MRKNEFGPNQIVTKPNLKWFLFELVQEKRSVLLDKINSVNQIVSIKLTRLIELIFTLIFFLLKSSLKINSELVRLLETF